MTSRAIIDADIQVSDSLNLRPYWLPFTANRAFKQAPRIVDGAQGFYYTTPDGRRVLDTLSGLWCSGLGHCHPKIVEAVQKQVAKLDYSVAFQVSHPGAFELAEQLTGIAPDGFTHCFFVNSGSEAVDTALKIALGFHRVAGQGQRTRLVGRERGYHGVNFGGMSVGGIPGNRRMFSGSLLPNVAHLPHTLDIARNAFSRGQPRHGVEFADALERLVAFHDPSTVAAVIVEPVAGSAGVLVPPVGYLERLREICTRHGILLIFDEVITGFGRLGAPFAAQRFDVQPDIITLAKGITNGVVPMGAVLVRKEIHDAFMSGPPHMVEFFHGYTCSAHPLATAAGIATLGVYRDEDIWRRSAALAPAFENAIHSFKDARNVIDVRNFGLMGSIELSSRPDAPGARGFEVHVRAFEQGVMVRNAMDTLQFCPFFTQGAGRFDEAFGVVRRILQTLE